MPVVADGMEDEMGWQQITDPVKGMLEASSHVGLTVRDDAIVGTCSICDQQRTFTPPVCLWDVLDMMGHHHRSNHR